MVTLMLATRLQNLSSLSSLTAIMKFAFLLISDPLCDVSSAVGCIVSRSQAKLTLGGIRMFSFGGC